MDTLPRATDAAIAHGSVKPGELAARSRPSKCRGWFRTTSQCTSSAYDTPQASTGLWPRTHRRHLTRFVDTAAEACRHTLMASEPVRPSDNSCLPANSPHLPTQNNISRLAVLAARLCSSTANGALHPAKKLISTGLGVGGGLGRSARPCSQHKPLPLPLPCRYWRDQPAPSI
jgi:hypothetical protein